MLCTPSFFAVALLAFSSVTPILSVRVAVPEQWRKKRFDAEQDVAKRLAERDYVCFYDNYLNGFKTDPVYFSSLCSSYLTETNAISTSDLTTTTTISTVYTTLGSTDSITATIPSSTITVTAAAKLLRRQTAYLTGAVPSAIPIGATAPQAISSMLSDCQASPTGEKLSILNSYSSACSCFISPGVDTVLVTLTSTRTISGQDHAEYTNTNSIISGVTTVTATAIPAPSSIFPTFTNATISATASSSAPPGPSLSSCPAANGTTYVTQGQTFEILCDVNYPGPESQGLSVPSLHQCIDDCAIVNVGFSQNGCFATTYNPNLAPGTPDCFFRTLPYSLAPFPDNTVISALLISPPPITNGTNGTSGIFPVYTGTGNVPSGSMYPTGSSLSRVGSVSAFPTISINVTTTPSFSISLTVSDNRTLVLPTGTGFMPSGSGDFPSGTGVLPSGTGILPSGSGVVPSGTGVLLSGSGISPPIGTGVPRTGVSPSGTGIFPTGTGFASSGTGISPSGSGSPNSSWCGTPDTVTVTISTTIYTANQQSTEVIFTETLSL